MALAILHGAQSDRGCKRPHNEDRFCADPELRLFVVCDGMGGNNAGEIASTVAVDTIRRHFVEAKERPELPFIDGTDERLTTTTNRLASAIRLANTAIVTSGAARMEWSGMGTTVVAAALAENLLSYAHVGDSRLYLVRNRTIQPLTRDHSWVAEQVSSGLLTEEEAERSPRRHILTRALGAQATVDVSLGELPLCPDDFLLLCSDGLTKGVGTSTILETFIQIRDVPRLSTQLITLANDSGGKDNTTVIVLAVREQ